MTSFQNLRKSFHKTPRNFLKKSNSWHYQLKHNVDCQKLSCYSIFWEIKYDYLGQWALMKFPFISCMLAERSQALFLTIHPAFVEEKDHTLLWNVCPQVGISLGVGSCHCVQAGLCGAVRDIHSLDYPHCSLPLNEEHS